MFDEGQSSAHEEQSLHEDSDMNQSQASNLSQLEPRELEKAVSPVTEENATVRLDIAMEQIVSSVVNKLSVTLQSLCVSDRVLKAQQTAEDWKEVCKLMIANPEIINEKLSINQGPSRVFKRIGADMSDPTKVSNFLKEC